MNKGCDKDLCDLDITKGAEWNKKADIASSNPLHYPGEKERNDLKNPSWTENSKFSPGSENIETTPKQGEDHIKHTAGGLSGSGKLNKNI
jgi:hypothetical protein